MVKLRPTGERRPFVCVHPAGGIVYCFLDLARALGADRPFWAVQAAGLEGDAEPLERVEAMAAFYVDALRRDQPEGPYHLGGWSLGGMVAFEMARLLGDEVGSVSLIDVQAPERPKASRAIVELAREAAELALFREAMGDAVSVEDVAVLLEFLGGMTPGFGRGARRLLERLKPLGADEQRREALRLFGLDRVYHQETEPERVRRLWRVLCRNLLAGARYEPGWYEGSVGVFRASEGRAADPSMGWSSRARTVRAVVVPGDHASMLHPPNVERLAEAVRVEIERREASDRE